MRRLLWVALGLFLLAGLGGIIFSLGFILSARTALDTPPEYQVQFMDMGKGFLIDGAYQRMANPVQSNAQTLANARRVYTARCVVCHGADGKGKTATGERMYPRAADLTAPRTQGKSDGALFWLTANGLPHTGMPGWKGLLTDEDMWGLVAYMRELPKGVPAVEAPTAAPPLAAPTTAPTTAAPTTAPTAAPQAAAPTTAPTTAPAQAAAPTTAPPTAPPPQAAAPTTAPTAAPARAAAPTTAPPPAPAAKPSAVTVRMSDYTFNPPQITVPVGTTVTWINDDNDDHDVQSESEPKVLNSPLFNKGGSWSFTFTQPGEYRYFCEPHDYMHGVVIVR